MAIGHDALEDAFATPTRKKGNRAPFPASLRGPDSRLAALRLKPVQITWEDSGVSVLPWRGLSRVGASLCASRMERFGAAIKAFDLAPI